MDTLKMSLLRLMWTSTPLQGIFIEHDWHRDTYEGKKKLVSSCQGFLLFVITKYMCNIYWSIYFFQRLELEVVIIFFYFKLSKLTKVDMCIASVFTTYQQHAFIPYCLISQRMWHQKTSNNNLFTLHVNATQE